MQTNTNKEAIIRSKPRKNWSEMEKLQNSKKQAKQRQEEKRQALVIA